MMKDKLITGKCGSPFALNGAVRLYTENSEENLKKEKNLTLIKGNREFELEIKEIFSKADKKYISFVGIDNPEDAKKILSGAEIAVSRNNAKTLAAGEVYCADLIDLEVFCGEKRAGVVESWAEGAQSILLRIRTDDGKEHIVPYIKEFVSEPDLKLNRIEVLKQDLLV